MTTAEFRPGLNLTAKEKAFKLLFKADESGSEVWWWIELLFVDEYTAEVMSFIKGHDYHQLHTKAA